MAGSGSEHAGRHRARELVVHGLYERQMSRRPDRDIAASLIADPGYARTEEADAADAASFDAVYFDALWRGVTGEWDALLAQLAPHVDRGIDALAPIERAVITIGAWELSHRLDIPYRVVINEAVELAKRYGGTDGYKFVNGVLDKVAARVRADEIRVSGRR
jgi:transcription antitermination protein NusB